MSQSEHRDKLMKVIAKVDSTKIHGHYIEPDVLEKVTGLKRTDAKYSLSLMACRNLLESMISMSHGLNVIIKQDKAGLRILAPGEAAEYGMSMFDRASKSQAFWHTKLEVCVPLDELEDDVRQRYLEKRTINARKLLAQQTIDLEG